MWITVHALEQVLGGARAIIDPLRGPVNVIDRVITNENRSIQQIRQYSPLVETYIQNLKPDKELGQAQGAIDVRQRFVGAVVGGVMMASATCTFGTGIASAADRWFTRLDFEQAMNRARFAEANFK